MSHLPPYPRPHVPALVDLLTERGPMRIAAVTGPRQCGKTTLVLQALNRIGAIGVPWWYVPVDQPAEAAAAPHLPRPPVNIVDPGVRPSPSWLVSTWQKARSVANQHPKGLVLVLDEVQRVDRWSIIAKGLWDADRRTGCPLRVVILGSAPWSMLTGIHESLAGRFDPFPVGHWRLREMQRAFGVTVDQYLYYGGYPGAAQHIRDEPRWRTHVRLAILEPVVERDIVALTRVDKPALMRTLLDIAPEYSGQVVSYQKLLGQLEDAGNTTTLARYLDLLGSAGLVAALAKHSAKPYRAKRSTPKLNVMNTAVMTAIAADPFDRALADRTFWGRLVESAVGAHLLATLPVDRPMTLRYWREGHVEADFVLVSGRRLLAIEVKSGRRRGSLTGLAAFEGRFPGARRLVVGTGGVPLEDFLSTSADHWLDEAHRGR